ncbi:MAG: hypothetical protein SFU99_13260 [Saprospiraceae bacterium]|nr:hypothetical protein [Saprospiraceae bacterium]
MANLTFQYPAWYLILCVLLGAAYALILYYRDKTFHEQSQRLNWLLGALRFITVTLLSMLLLSPLLKSLITESKKPVIILAQDQSESVAAEMNEQERTAYQKSFEDLAKELARDYEVQQYAFGGEVREGVDFTFQDKVTNVSKLLTNVYDLYSNQNLGAIILATDGIYNEGSNPLYLNTKLTAPVYTVALGDTTVKKDVVLKRVFHNKIAYLGDKFTVQLDIAAQNCTGANTSLSVYKLEGNNARKLQQTPVNIDRSDFFITREVILDADQSGVQRFRIVVEPIAGEATNANNSKEIFIDVLDARQKILIVANSPHPDVTALRQSINANKNYQVDLAYANDLKVNIADYDFVILHQLPSRNFDASGIINTLQKERIPRLFIAGMQTNFVRLNQLQSLITIQSDGRNSNDVQGRPVGTFNNFTLSEELIQNLPNFPPLTAPFGEFEPAPDASVLLTQRIGKLDTRYPLFVLGEENGVKVGVLCAEGIWKWRLFDFLQHQNHQIFDEILGKSVQFLSLKEDKRKFRVTPTKNIFNENEPVLFDAELYNDNYELINEPDARIVITNSSGKDFDFTFNKNGRSYSLNAGIFPTGNYTFRATVTNAGQNLTATGQFSVQPVQLELFETTANHNLLRLLSEQYGGAMVYPDNIAQITDLIKEKGTVKPVIFETSKTRAVINLKWIFFLLLLLLTGEWFLRRYFGAY